MSYQQEDVPAHHPSKLKERKFFGWKIGSNLTEAQADLLEPIVDVMIEMLQAGIMMPPEFDKVMSQHEMALHILEHAGASAGVINQISTMMATEHNENERALQLKLKAATLRVLWIQIALLAAKAVINLDQIIKEDKPNEPDSQ